MTLTSGHVYASIKAVQQPKNIALWQVNTLEATDEQLVKLYSIPQNELLKIDDSAINYTKLGVYPLLFHMKDGQVIAKRMTIQLNSPVLMKELPILQLEVGKQLELSPELLQSYLGSEDENGFSYKIIKESIDINRVGRYETDLQITDPYGRTKVTTIFAEVTDLQAPKLYFNKKKLAYLVGEKITTDDLERDANVRAVDNYSKKLSYEWYLDKLDFQLAGDYEIGITAKDESGNVSEMQYLTISVGQRSTLKNSLQYEVNEKVSEETVVKDLASPTIEKISYEQIDFSTVASYQMDVSLIGNLKTTVEINIVDTTPPILTSKVTKLEYENAEQFNEKQLKEDLQLEVKDNYDQKLIVYYSKAISQLKRSGQHQVVIYAKDTSGNVAELPISLKVGQNNLVVPIKKAEDEKPKQEKVTAAILEKDESKNSDDNGFKYKTIYAATQTEEFTTEVLEPMDQVAATLKNNNGTNEEGGTIFLIPVFVLILLLFAVVAIHSRRKQMKRKPEKKQKSY